MAPPVRPERHPLNRALIAIAVLLVVGGSILIVNWVVREVHSAREEALRGVCQGHLKRLALALSLYCHDYGTLPPAYVEGQDGKPMHSWRVLILPYLECGSFYNQYDFSQSWSSQHNLALARSHPDVARNFQCPCDPGARGGCSSYLVIVGPETLWPGARTLTFHELKEGASKILVVERNETGVWWTEPRDLSCKEALRGISRFSPHPGQAHFVLPNGRVGVLEEQRVSFSFWESNDIWEWTDRYSGFPPKREAPP